MTSRSTRAADAIMLLGMASKLKKSYVLMPVFQRGKLLSNGRVPQLVGEGEFAAATIEFLREYAR